MSAQVVSNELRTKSETVQTYQYECSNVPSFVFAIHQAYALSPATTVLARCVRNYVLLSTATNRHSLEYVKNTYAPLQRTITTRARVCHAESRAKRLPHTRTVAADLSWVDVKQISLPHPRSIASSVIAHIFAYTFQFSAHQYPGKPITNPLADSIQTAIMCCCQLQQIETL